MKVLTTIATLLFTFLAFSQDLVEYRDFKFYQNGSEISFDEVTELTKEFGVAQVAFRQVRRDFTACESTTFAIARNIIRGAVACSAGAGAMVVVGAGILNITGGVACHRARSSLWHDIGRLGFNTNWNYDS